MVEQYILAQHDIKFTFLDVQKTFGDNIVTRLKIDQRLNGSEQMTTLLYALDQLKEEIGGVKNFKLSHEESEVDAA